MNARIICLVVAVLICLNGYAQQLHFVGHSVPSMQDIQPSVALEAKDGFIWLGTNEGLFRFDGLTFEAFPLKDSIGTSEISALFEDAKGQIWVGFENGAIAQKIGNSDLQLWDIEEGQPKVPITGFEEEDSGRLWIATYGEGLYCYQNNRLYNFNLDDGLLGNDLYCLARNRDNEIWVGTDRGINICAISDRGDKTISAIMRKDGLPDDIIRTLLFDEHGDCWVGTYDQGIARVSVSTHDIETISSPIALGPVRSLALFEERELWIGSESQGLFRYDFSTSSFQKIYFHQGQEWGKVLDLHKDIEGNIWVLSNQQGVALANRQFEFLDPQVGNVQALLEDSRRNLWVGNDQGLYRYDFVSNQYVQELSDLALNILSLYEDKFGNIWIGTFGDGIYCYHPTQKTVRHISEADGLSNGSVLSIDGINGHVWMATLGGVTELAYKKDVMLGGSLAFTNYSQNSNLGTNFIYKVFIDSKERTWFCTDGKGISVWENGGITNYSEANGEPLQAVYSITEDHRGHIWFSTAKHGIYEFNDTSFNHLTVKEGIRDLEISSLITDENSNILLVHPTGIDILNPLTRHLIYYDDEVGVNAIEPNLNAVARGADGVLWIGTQNRIIRYTALKEELSIHPRTQLLGVSAFLESLPFDAHNRFAYDQNSLVFDYVGLWYSDPLSVKYRYQLENFDQDWISSRDRKATYSNLPPGTYTFKVMSTENEAFDQEPVVSYAFEIVPPLWQRWWVILLGGTCIAYGLFFYIRLREKRMEKEANLRKEMVESQFEALKSQINPHFLFNTFNTLVTLIEEEPALAVNFVEHLSDFYRSILQYREHDLITIAEELELVKNYAYLLKKRFGENLILAIEFTPEDSQSVAPLTLQILLENAIKHNVIAQGKQLFIRIRQVDDYIEVSNNLQPKLTKEPSTGFGLQNITSRYALLSNKKIEIEQKEGMFAVRIPIIKKQVYEGIDYRR